MTLSFLQELSAYEAEILLFVEHHHKNLKKNWKTWLKTNPIPQNILEIANETNNIRVSKAKSYKIEISNTINFYEFIQEDSDINSRLIHIEISNITRSLATDINTSINQKFELQLLGIFHYIQLYPKDNSLVLYFDYLIKKVTIEAKEKSIELEPLPLPVNLPQQTFIEARRVAQALADGPRLLGWESITGEVGLRHVKSDMPIQPRIILKNVESDWSLPSNCEQLRKELENLEQPSLLLLNVAIGAVLQRPQTTASIDELISYIGWQPRSHQERLKMRRKIWRWMLLFDSISIHGKRPGKYQDKFNDKEVDIVSMDALIKVIGRRFVKDSFNGQTKEIPLEITWVAGHWLEQWRGDPEILNYFGDLSKIAAIATGKASGAWAQSIGLALHQFWRERAGSNVFDIAKRNQLTNTKKLFTRIELLSLFRCEPWVESLLKSDKPIRAKHYWQEAIRKLKFEAGIIGYYKELDPVPNTRKAWRDVWFKEQKLDIRPK